MRQLLGPRASAGRRAATALVIGLVVALALLPFTPWQVTVVGGWDATAVAFLATMWTVLARADGPRTARLAAREDPTHITEPGVLLIGASVASLIGVGFVLGLAGRVGGGQRALLVTVAVVTVVLSWTVINLVYTMRYARMHYMYRGGFAFDEEPSYRDFAYVALTIGMTYQVADTAIRDRRTRRTVLTHALLSYVFGVVIVAGAINLIAGLIG